MLRISREIHRGARAMYTRGAAVMSLGADVGGSQAKKIATNNRTIFKFYTGNALLQRRFKCDLSRCLRSTERACPPSSPLSPFQNSAALPPSPGPLGFEGAQHRQTLRPSVEGVRSEILRLFGLQ